MSQSLVSFPHDNLFTWYDLHGRELPWRYHWPELAPVYNLWLSEIMLQQTVVATVIPYFLDFTGRWPTIEALAAASVDDVLSAWAGLGYYARARNLHKTAQIVTNDHGGVFPKNQKDLLALPGIGPYTSSAIMVMGYGKLGVVVDVNIERVMSRYFAIQTPLPKAKLDIAIAYEHSRPNGRLSDFPQALMDFANAVCTSKAPGCSTCSLASGCLGYANGIVDQLPHKAPKPIKPVRYGVVFVAINHNGEAFMERRPNRGLLGGMKAFPSFGWSNSDQFSLSFRTLEHNAPFVADWQLLEQPVHHVFTHFSLEMKVYVAEVSELMPNSNMGCWQVPRPNQLPSLMRKVWKQVGLSQPIGNLPKNRLD